MIGGERDDQLFWVVHQRTSKTGYHEPCENSFRGKWIEQTHH
jgi:hypothetical protein